MRCLIVYYSHTGNTAHVAALLADYLKDKAEVAVTQLKPKEDTGNFFSQASGAFRHKRVLLEDASYDVSPYEIICLGTPVWAFAPAPAMNAYLDNCCGIGSKKVIFFTTSGGMGDARCIAYMQEILARKGAAKFSSFSIAQARVKQRDYVLSRIKESVG
jgi:flavodoxin